MSTTAYDRIAGTVLLVLGAAAIWQGLGLQVAFAADPLGPKAFPIIVGAILAIAGGCLVLRPDRLAWQAGNFGRVVAVMLVCLLYPLMLVPLGFVPASALLGFVLALSLGGGVLKSALGATVTALLILLLIDGVLGLSLPRGPLGV